MRARLAGSFRNGPPAGRASLGLVDGGLEGARVDLEQRLTLLHQVAFAVVLLDQVAGHLRPDDGIDVAVERADPFHVDRHVLLRDGDTGKAVHRCRV
jgi:hypothetical protein